MRRHFLAAATVGAVLVGGLATPSASAATPSWLKVTTTTRAKAYHSKRVTITPKATASGQRVITSLRITAYRGKKKIASGKTIKLRPGRYRTRTTGTYRTYRDVPQTVSRPVLHPGAEADATCTVVHVQPAFLLIPAMQTGQCTNPYYPTQVKVENVPGTGPVGATYVGSFPFVDETVIETSTTTVREYGTTTKFTSSKRSLTVRDRGRRR